MNALYVVPMMHVVGASHLALNASDSYRLEVVVHVVVWSQWAGCGNKHHPSTSQIRALKENCNFSHSERRLEECWCV